MGFPYNNSWQQPSYYPMQGGYVSPGYGTPAYPQYNQPDFFPNSAMSHPSAGGGDPFGDPNMLMAMLMQGGYDGGSLAGNTGGNAGHGGTYNSAYSDPMRAPVKTDLIEVGYYNNGNADQHAQSVKQIYQQNNPLGQNNVQYVGIGNDQPAQGDNSDAPTHLANKQELDQYIDTESSDAFNLMSDNINQIVKQGDAKVINGSLGYSRNTVYENVLLSLRDNPNLASNLGLKPSDISSLETNDQGQVLVSDQVANAIVNYVDNRMDQPGSAYQQGLAKYQAATKNAAANGVTVVVAAGNDHDLNDVFTARKQGGDTNFLAQSDYVISVAATDNKGTASPNDDQIASFSSWGDGRYNPTIAAQGVGVPTKFGKQDGTSFSAPQVAATVARMEQVNPYLTFDQIKAILQQTATDIQPNSTIADGAGVMNPDSAVQWAQQLSQTA